MERKGAEATAQRIAKKKEEVLEYLRESLGIVSYACEKANISRMTFYNYKDSDIDFANAVEEIGEKAVDIAESKLLSQINDDNLTAIIFYLKTKGKKRGYVEQQEIKHQGNAFEELLKGLPDDPNDER